MHLWYVILKGLMYSADCGLMDSLTCGLADSCDVLQWKTSTAWKLLPAKQHTCYHWSAVPGMLPGSVIFLLTTQAVHLLRLEALH